jgi:hypothetical protein
MSPLRLAIGGTLAIHFAVTVTATADQTRNRDVPQQLTPSPELGFTGPRAFFPPERLESMDPDLEGLLQLPEAPFWMPTVEQADQVDVVLVRKLPEWTRTYGRQYLGYLRQDRRIIQVRGFCDQHWGKPNPGRFSPPGTAWQRTPVLLLDGTSCVFQADIELESGTILDLQWGTPGP